MKKLFLLLAAIVSIAVCAQAQTRTIHGTVLSSADDEPLIGATVMPVGGGEGVATDVDGRFTLTLPASIKEVTVTYVGMKAATLPVQAEMKIYLDPASTLLDNVVVTGYGTGKKLGSVVGAVNIVTSQKFEDSPAPNIVDALQGSVPGLAIFSNSGEPASLPSIMRIRGKNSLKASTTPLFILDGTPVSSVVLQSINSNDIENITVLKDAASTAIYGSRAANGVIVITTKKGKYAGDAKITLRANYGWSARVQDKIKVMNSEQFIHFRDLIGVPVSQAERDAWEVYGINTNWDKELISDSAPTYSIEAAAQGGSEKLRYYISLSHYNQDGLVYDSGFQREALSARMDANLKSWLKVGLNANLSYQKAQSNANIQTAKSYMQFNPFLQAKQYLPYDSPWFYTTDENGRMQYHGKAYYLKYTGLYRYNYLLKIQPSSNNTVTANIGLYEQITPVKGLTIRAQQAVDAFDYRATSKCYPQGVQVTPMGDVSDLSSLTGRRSEAFQRYYQFTYTNTIEYKFPIAEKHNFTLLAGQESVLSKNQNFNVRTTGQPNAEQMLLTNGTDVLMSGIGQGFEQTALNSWFFNFSYEFDNRYFIDASYRRDGSSKFAPGNRWANFFSVGAMWNLKGEKFLADKTWLDDLKLRVSYGTTGNSGISNYMYFGTVGSSTNYDGEPSSALSGQSNNALTWETVRNFDAGVSFSFLNRIYGTFDYYVKNTDDMLMDLPYSITTGYSGGWANIGSLRNKGYDAEVGFHFVQTKDWYFGARLNFNYNKTYITKLFNGEKEYTEGNTGTRYTVGKDPSTLYAVRYKGVDPRDGKQLWLTKDGNLTKKFDKDNDEVDLGKTYRAPWTGGFGIDARWKDLSLRADFAWAANKYIFECTAQSLRDAQEYDNNQVVEMLNVWTKPGDVTDIPNATEKVQFDTRYLQNATFVRMKNLTLAYSLPKTWMRAIKMDNITFHFTGRNLLTFTKDGFTGADPEYENNLVRFEYPNTRQYEFGVEVTF